MSPIDAVGATVRLQRQQRWWPILPPVLSPPIDGPRGRGGKNVLSRLGTAEHARRHIRIGERHGDDDVADPVGLRPDAAGAEYRIRTVELGRPEITCVEFCRTLGEQLRPTSIAGVLRRGHGIPTRL